MDAEKSSNSSFEDLTNLNESDVRLAENSDKEETPAKQETPVEKSEEKDVIEDDDEDVCDLLGNKQLVKRILKKSTNTTRPRRGDLVTISFICKLSNGKVIEREEKSELHIGDHEVVQGLDLVLPVMNVGEKAEIIVDSRFAYGSAGLKNPDDPELSIPPGETITYELELLDTKYEDFADLKGFEIRRKYGTRKKERANFWYNRGEYNTAIQLYRRALEFLDNRDGDPDSEFDKEDLELSTKELQVLLDDRLVVFNNLAMAQIKISAYDAALKSVENVLRCQPNNSKAIYRKGRILEGQGDTKGAIKLLQKAATLEPDNRTIQQDLARLFIKSRREEHNEKEMYQKMLGQAKKMEQKNKSSQRQPTPDNSTLKLIGYLMGSILIGVVGVAIYRYKY